MFKLLDKFSWLGFVFTVIGLNLIFILVTHYYELPRPLINIDYLLIIIFCYKKNLVNTVGFFVTFLVIYLVDIILIGLNVFPFIHLNDILYLSVFFFNSPSFYKLLTFASFLLFIALFILIRDGLIKKIALTVKQILTVFIIYLGLLFLTVMNNQTQVIGSQLWFFVEHNQSNMLEISKQGVISDLRTQYATKPLVQQLKNNSLPSKKILLIINESWGETAESYQQDVILESIYKKKTQLADIRRGQFSVVGSTVAAEFRELCQKKLLAMDIKNIDKKNYHQCIPNLMKAKGYSTYSVHGADATMYDRNIWYPLAGFDNRYFYNELPMGAQCKSFNGRCDSLLIPKIKQLLMSSDKSFVYWMTLNTHAPYDDKLFNNTLNCKRVGLDNDTAVCGNYQLQNQFFDALSQLIGDPAMKGVEVFIVGDHPPPLMELSDGLKAFNNSQVAWLHFKIK